MSYLLDKLWELHARAEDSLIGGMTEGYIQGLREQAEALLTNACHRPIPVSERLPQESGWYLVFNPRDADQWHLAEWDGSTWNADEWFDDEDRLVTHWLPIPPKPE